MLKDAPKLPAGAKTDVGFNFEGEMDKDNKVSKSMVDFSSLREYKKSGEGKSEDLTLRPNLPHKTIRRKSSGRNSISKEDIEGILDSSIQNKLDRISGSNKKFHKRINLPDEIVIEDYICAILLRGALLSQGSMYITHNYVCFYSNIFGKKTVVTLPFSEILLVRKTTILKIPNSIEIITPTKSYFWASFLHRDDAFELIENVWKVYLKKEGKTPISEAAANFLYNESQSSIDSDVGYDWKEEEDEEDRGLYPPISDECKHEVQLEIYTEPTYTQSLPISALDYYYTFFSEKAVNFWKEFHAKGGYLNFELENWNPSAENCCFERRAKFKAPIGFSKYTRVTQQQRVRFTNDDKVIFETSSFSKDVPYGNHFLVESKWVLTNLDDSHSELKIYISVKFIKHNWLKMLIESSAMEGTKYWFANWIKSTQRLITNLETSESAQDVVRKSIRSYKTTNETNGSLQANLSSELTEKKVNKLVQYGMALQSMSESLFLILLLGLLLFAIVLFVMFVVYFLRNSFLSSQLEVEIQNYKVYEGYLANSNPEIVATAQRYGEIWRSMSSDIHNLEQFLPVLSQIYQNLLNKSQL